MKLSDYQKRNSKMFIKKLKIINNIQLMKERKLMKVLKPIKKNMLNNYRILEMNLDKYLMMKQIIRIQKSKEETIECSHLKMLQQKKEKIGLLHLINNLHQLMKELIKAFRTLKRNETLVFRKKEKYQNSQLMKQVKQKQLLQLSKKEDWKGRHNLLTN